MPSLSLLGLFVVNSQVPLSVFFESMSLDKVILLPGGWLVLAPGVPFVKYKASPL